MILTSAQAFINIGASKNQKRATTRASTDFAQLLGHVVGDNHPRPRLDVLQSKILCGCAPVNY